MSPTWSGPGARAAGLAICLVCLAARPAPGRAELRAERVDETNAAELLLEGPDAIGGIGDWALANDVIVYLPSWQAMDANFGSSDISKAASTRT